MDDVPKDNRLVPAIIDFRAQKTPDRIFGFLPKGNSLEDGFLPLTYQALAKAVDAAAWWLDDVLGRKEMGSSHPAIPYIGAVYFLYILLRVAAKKTKRQLMVPLLYSVEAFVRLLRASSCTFVMASKNHTHYWNDTRAALDNLPLIVVPEISEFIHDRHVEHYPYEREYNEGLDEPFVMIQTSGTTGTPKPLPWDNRTALFTMCHEDISTSTDKLVMPELLNNTYIPNVFPMSWSVGIFNASLVPLAYGSVIIMLPENAPQPATTDYLVEIIKHTPKGSRNGLMSIPNVLRNFAKSPQYLDLLKQYDWVAFAGAPLDHDTGDLIGQVTRIQSFSGDTMYGFHPLLYNEPADWKIQRFPNALGFYFDHFNEDLYELCIKRQPQDSRPCFLLDATIDTFRTKDLWRLVPGRDGFYSPAGRVDDFVKLSSLSKFNAIEIEQILNRHAEIESSLVAGDGRKHPFALIQLTRNPERPREEALKLIREAIEKANVHLSDEVKLREDLIVFSEPHSPIKRTAKGTVDRRNTMKMYSDQIDDIYKRAGYDGPTQINGSS